MSLKDSFCRWCFESVPLSELAAWCRELGIEGIDLLHPHEVPEIEKFGLICPVTAAPEHPTKIGSIENAFNQTANHSVLFDLDHMQVMEGDVMATIKKAARYIGHYHTAGCPGRHEIDETQELYYPAIVQAIKQTGYTGFLAQEFIPT